MAGSDGAADARSAGAVAMLGGAFGAAGPDARDRIHTAPATTTPVTTTTAVTVGNQCRFIFDTFIVIPALPQLARTGPARPSAGRPSIAGARPSPHRPVGPHPSDGAVVCGRVPRAAR